MTTMEREGSRAYEMPVIWRRALWAWLAMAVIQVIARQALRTNYNLLRGRLWPIVLATIVAAPFVWGRPQQPRS